MSNVARKFAALIGAAMVSPLVLVPMAPAVDAVVPTRDWNDPATPLSAAGRDASEPDVVVGGNDVTTVVWSRAGKVQARQRSQGGVWQGVVTLGNGDDPQVDVDAAGNVTVVWETPSVDVVSRRKPYNKPWQPLVVLQGGGKRWATGAKGGMDPAIDVSPSGHVLVAWYWGSYDAKPFGFQTRIRTASPTGKWSKITNLTGFKPDPVFATPAIGRSGWAAVLLYEWPRLKVIRHLPGGGAWSAPFSLGRASEYSIAMSPNGATAILWRRGGGVSATIYGRYAAPGAAFQSETRLSPEASGSVLPLVAIDKTNHALAVWWDGVNEQVGVADHLGSGSWWSSSAFGSPAVDVQGLDLAVNPDGDAAVALSYAPETTPNNTQAWAALRPLEAGWVAPERVTANGGYTTGYDLQLAMPTDWHPVAVWTTRIGGSTRVVFSDHVL